MPNLDERNIAAREWLAGTGMDADLEKHQTLQLHGTCEWFFKNLKFQAWLAARGSSTLSLRGVPGSGKSIVASTLVRYIERDSPQCAPVLYFFCKKNDRCRDSTSAMIRTLTLQLVSHSVYGPGLSDILSLERSVGVPAKDVSQQRLWGMLNKMIGIIPAVYLIIDALDECSQPDELKVLLGKITKLAHSTNNIVKVLVTYRPNEFEIDWPSIDIEEQDVEADITAYATYRIGLSPTLSRPVHRQRICDAIQLRAGGTFLWVKLVLDILHDSSPRQIQDVLANIPRGLSNTYRLMLERVCDRDSGSVVRCRKVLHWCVAAPRLLTVDELLLALAVSEGASSHEEYNAETDIVDSQRVLRLQCGSLIHVLKDNSVQLLHTTLREYLLHQHDGSVGEHEMSISSMQVVDLRLVHRDLAIVCLEYNQFACFQANIDMKDLLEYGKRFPFSEYAIRTWIHHVCFSGDSHSTLLKVFATFLDSIQGWRWLHRCEDLNISRGHLHVFQGELNTWIKQSVDCPQDDSTFAHLGNFVLYLAERFYHDACQEPEVGNDRLADAESRLGLAYSDSGLYDEAQKWCKRGLVRYETVLGKEHPWTLNTVNNIAMTYYHQGRYEDALKWYERALAGRENVLGKEHPSTLDSVSGIANMYQAQGRHDEALEWNERALTGYEKAHGKEHPSTLDLVHNIASVHLFQGDYAEAMEGYERALAGREKVLGKEHPSTLNTVNNIGGVFDVQGRCEEALEWYERALVGREKVHGTEHPSTLNTLNNMAIVYDMQGRSEQAVEFYKRALAGYEKVHGIDHPSTLSTVNNIAAGYQRQGQYGHALEWYERALVGREKVLGMEHPLTLNTVNNMAGVYQHLGRCDHALEWYERALIGREKIHGKEHPSTLDTVYDIGIFHSRQGRDQEALQWWERALAGYKKSFGTEHSSTLRTAGCLNRARARLECNKS